MTDQKKNALIGRKVTNFPSDGRYLTLGCNGSRILFVHCPENDYNSKVYELNLENYRFYYYGMLKSIGKNNDGGDFLLKTIDDDGFPNKDILYKIIKKII